MKTVLETIDEFGELHFPEIFNVITVDCLRSRKLEIDVDGKIRDALDLDRPRKRRKLCI